MNKAIICTLLLALSACQNADAKKNEIKAVRPEPVFRAAMPYDSQSALIDLQIAGEPARVVFDTGAAALALYEESFEFSKQEGFKALKAKNLGGFGSGKAKARKVTGVTIKWGEKAIRKQTAYVLSFKAMNFPVSTAPYFDGILAPFIRTDKDTGEKEGVYRIDPTSKSIEIYSTDMGLIGENWLKFPLTLTNKRKFITELTIVDPTTQTPKSLKLVVDTGAEGTEILLREGVIDFATPPEYTNNQAGIGGLYKKGRLDPLQINLGPHNFNVRTDVTNSLPDGEAVDGYLGYKFIKRFETVIDIKNGYIAFNPKTGNFSNFANIRSNRFLGLPSGDWSGFVIFDPKEWSEIGLEKGRIVTKVDGLPLSPTNMYTPLNSLNENSEICWKKHHSESETCSRLNRN